MFDSVLLTRVDTFTVKCNILVLAQMGEWVKNFEWFGWKKAFRKFHYFKHFDTTENDVLWLNYTEHISRSEDEGRLSDNIKIIKIILSFDKLLIVYP